MIGALLRLLRRVHHARLCRELDRLPFAARGVKGEILPRGTFENPERIHIGSHVFISHGAAFHAVGGIWIGDNISISPNVHIHTSNHRYEGDALPYDAHSVLKPVRIESHAWIGANVLICPGVTIGEGAIVAMGAVVTKDVPPLTLVGGNPARPIRERDRARFERLKAAGAFYMRQKHEPGYTGPKYITAEEEAALRGAEAPAGNTHESSQP